MLQLFRACRRSDANVFLWQLRHLMASTVEVSHSPASCCNGVGRRRLNGISFADQSFHPVISLKVSSCLLGHIHFLNSE